MPTSPPTRCSNCGELKKGQCPNGCDSWAGRPSPNWQKVSPQGKAIWKRVQLKRLKIEPFCRMCAEDGVQTPATQVDHLDGSDYGDDSRQGASWLNIDMTRSICESHHQVRTAQQSAAARFREE
jgi:hypothetical protein